MLYCKFKVNELVAWGTVEQHEVVEVSAPFETWTPTGRRFLMGDVQLLAPVLPTTKLICVGLNYQDHIEEFGRTGTPAEPVLFLKAPSAIIGLDVPIRIPSFAGPD
jgi:2-keto-4-pentenoate hydratase/2-oxohepta-3-ene-1,7-dioic acid hydratase in catechol pathway